MAKRESNNASAIIVLGILAFAIGRCSNGGTAEDEQATKPLGFTGSETSYSSDQTLSEPPQMPAPPAEVEPQESSPITPFGNGEEQSDQRSNFVEPPPPPAASAYFANCSAARAAGAAPVRAGDPGYRRGLDRDGDGVGCE